MLEFQLYFDESGTHSSSPVMIMGGLVGSHQQFANLRPVLDKIRQRYGFDIFHAVDMKGGRKDFQAWLPEKQLALTYEFSKLIAKNITTAADAVINKDEYKTHYFDDQRFPESPKDSMYGLCFRMCLIGFLESIEAAHRYHQTPYIVHVTVESGDPNYRDAKRIFEETRSLSLKIYGIDPLGDFRTATKKECSELMIADFIAYTSFMRHNQEVNGISMSMEDLAANGLPILEALPQNIYSISFEPEKLAQLSAHIAMLNDLLRG